MKKVLYFLAGTAFTIIITVTGTMYYFKNTTITISQGGTDEQIDLSFITDESVEHALTNKMIDRISTNEYDSMTKRFTNKTIVTFWASWCGSCLQEIPQLKAYAEKEGIDLVFLNFDKQGINQSKIIIDKMKKLDIAKTYQLIGNEKMLDPTGHRMLNSFLDDRNIKMNTLGLPVNLIYEDGAYTNNFGPLNIDTLYANQLDKHFR